MKPSIQDLKELRQMETRLQSFKQRNFEQQGYDGSKWFFMKILASGFFIAILTLLTTLKFLTYE